MILKLKNRVDVAHSLNYIILNWKKGKKLKIREGEDYELQIA